MDDLINEAQKAKKIIEPRIDFCREIFIFLDMAKAIHPTLPVTFTQYLGKLNEFENEIDDVMQKVKDTWAKKLISPSEFHEINANANTTKNRLIELSTKDLIKNHIKDFVEVSKKPILTQDIFKIIEEPEIEPVEINPLEPFFNKYYEELIAVATTNSLEKFTDAFKYWLQEDIFPLTLNKAEELLLKNIFKKIKKKVQKMIDESEVKPPVSTESEELITKTEETQILPEKLESSNQISNESDEITPLSAEIEEQQEKIDQMEIELTDNHDSEEKQTLIDDGGDQVIDINPLEKNQIEGDDESEELHEENVSTPPDTDEN